MALTSCSDINKPELREGSRGESVRELQELLRKNGQEISVDGIFGAGTKYVVGVFQCIMFLPRNGEVDNNTWCALFRKAPADMEVLRKGDKSELVRKVQQRLYDDDRYRSTIDGDFGPVTETAVKGLQKDKGLVVDGIIGEKTWNELSNLQYPSCL
ncbi:peptidoglycan-binding domain-containing protein [Mastigocoleus testarum]|uniref:Peptidoglycan binding-like domain-containing protein n=1 Tax=Mastigocoleus testarum BC008 TaxID=371196 RepID=A0A0V7ZHJ8_9CYAN|nr:peptidoglycan-binding protein [Mastigocoleus testarum]KST64052.1 hypothetical protein BC008_40365 [Mastigocoleus testarum BC008]KST64762.1 hypothetical protein BC008_41340 [Mastigocoleus testarum BC008]